MIERLELKIEEVDSKNRELELKLIEEETRFL